MIDGCDPATLTGLRDRAALVLGFALMGRRAELAALDIEDLALTVDGLEVTIGQSKTDQDARGEVVPCRTQAPSPAVRDERGRAGAGLPGVRESDRLGADRSTGPLLRNTVSSGRAPGHAPRRGRPAAGRVATPPADAHRRAPGRGGRRAGGG
ncbi:hypothetical protein [Streptosporangium vulgare]|uniref:hypothetical protein n=1 Tax=Streptosporangium vulgare TaxID=46190 RepID=UPI0031DCDD6B